MEMDSKVIAAVSAVVALGILTYGILNLTTSASNSSPKKRGKGEATTTKKKSTAAAKNSQGNGSTASDENQDLSLRGYKKTSTGKTTTYFHRELTAEEKKLLGDQTPKRIDSPASAATTSVGSLSPNPTAGSAWNSAGTYEEKNISDWAQKTLRKKLKQLCHSIPAGGQVDHSS
jgi:hypothetical protein